MSRYLLLIILNLPIIIIGIMSSTVAFKIKKLSKKRYILHLFFWTIILSGLLLAYPIYNYLFTNELTQTEPLSLFDVVQITAIIFLLFITGRNRAKIESMERRVNELHQEASIILSVSKHK